MHTLEALIEKLKQESVPDYLYALHGALGGGEIHGIEHTDKGWCVYYSERGAKNNPTYFTHEAEAVQYFARCIEDAVASYEHRIITL